MKRRAGLWGRMALGLALAALGSNSAFALTLQELQRELQASPKTSIAFQELRESPWLSAPVHSTGTMRATPHALEKQTVSPRPQTWRLLPDRVEWLDGTGSVSARMSLDNAPALSALGSALRRVVAGDLAALAPDFRLALTGDERSWAVHLQPRSDLVRRYLDHLELQGSGAQLQVIIVVERQGERTTTWLRH